MTRADRRIWRNLIIMLFASFGALWLVGKVVIWLYPQGDLERCLLSKTTTTLHECKR